MSGIGSESLQGFFGQANNHGTFCQRLGSISLAGRTLQRYRAIDGDGERHKGEIVKARKREIKVQRAVRVSRAGPVTGCCVVRLAPHGANSNLH